MCDPEHRQPFARLVAGHHRRAAPPREKKSAHRPKKRCPPREAGNCRNKPAPRQQPAPRVETAEAKRQGAGVCGGKGFSRMEGFPPPRTPDPVCPPPIARLSLE